MAETDNCRHSKMRASLNRLIAHGSAQYDRERHLPRLIAVHPGALVDPDDATRRDIIQRLNRALRGERNKAHAGTWSYNLNRHIALLQAYKPELEMLGNLIKRQRRECHGEHVRAGSRPSGFPRRARRRAPARME